MQRTDVTYGQLGYHLVGARTTLDLFGVADPKVFDAKLQKVG
jgi:hypothetical protein